MSPPGGARSSRGSGGAGAILGLFVTILIIEFVLDVVLFPADEVLVPAEVVGDALFLVVSILTLILGSRAGGGRQVGGQRAIRGSRRGVLRLQHDGRAVGGAGVGIIVAVWALFAAILGFQWWWSQHHPVLQVLTLPFEIVFDLVGILFSIGVTFLVLVGGRGPSGREVGG